MGNGQADRRRAIGEMKRELILDAARRVFEADGLDGASLRSIAKAAGYTPAALYFHFDSKEAIYAEVLEASLRRLGETVDAAVEGLGRPEDELEAAAMAFFGFYAENPRDLDLGFYLLRGGMKPQGLGATRDERLNARLGAALAPIGRAAEAMGAERYQANRLTVEIFAHAAGLLLLAHTGRIRMFGASAPELMRRYVRDQMALLRRRD
ncbi:TetR/AcrR family transcriptional regulator [Aurantimonas sp. A3-2-R12]|uniref:TetR/AcrR family transcriptional regulator n=1 Tax=Aurantimonas sp. A3-2-R12 TaxID=3114362 RepID=UPI002E19ADA5|nr:helix-turn-helix domain-containing protein [Aurantimonas sp. A3-2-R12]